MGAKNEFGHGGVHGPLQAVIRIVHACVSPSPAGEITHAQWRLRYLRVHVPPAPHVHFSPFLDTSPSTLIGTA